MSKEKKKTEHAMGPTGAPAGFPEQSIQLTAEEQVIIIPFFSACDGRVRGYAEAMEAAKRALLEQVIAARKKA